MIYTKEKFKELWEANKYGSGITHDDIADCAKAWGISSHPRTRPIDEITYKVLKAAQVNDAEEYNPNPTSQCEERIIKTCRTCKHRQRWQCGGRVIQYCGKQRSNRTFNHLKKIKVTNQACKNYEND